MVKTIYQPIIVHLIAIIAVAVMKINNPRTHIIYIYYMSQRETILADLNQYMTKHCVC